MDTIRTFRHREYEVVCTAKPADGGRFVPTLIVSKQVWPTRPREIAVARGDYQNEETALDAASAQGIEWISNYG